MSGLDITDAEEAEYLAVVTRILAKQRVEQNDPNRKEVLLADTSPEERQELTRVVGPYLRSSVTYEEGDCGCEKG